MGSDGSGDSGSGIGVAGAGHGTVMTHGMGAQEQMQGTGGAQGTMMGARALVGQGARLWRRTGTLAVEEAGRSSRKGMK